MNEDYKRRSSLLIITHKFALTGEAAIFIEEDFASARASSANPQLEFFSAFSLRIFVTALLHLFWAARKNFGQPQSLLSS